MKYQFIDTVVSQDERSIVALKKVIDGEDFLQDHFPTFPVMPGVLMIETLVQAARMMLAEEAGTKRLVLCDVRALRYGAFVKPGDTLQVEVKYTGYKNDCYHCRGIGTVIRGNITPEEQANMTTQPETAVSGRFSLRHVRISAPTIGSNKDD